MVAASPFSEAERRQLREIAKDVINGGRVSTWNREHAGKWLPLIQMTVLCLGRESAEVLHLPFDGGFLEQPMRTMQAVGVVQEVFGERLRDEYKKRIKRG